MRQLIILFLCFCSFTRVADSQSTFNINLDAVRRSVVFLHIVDQSGQLREAGTAFLLEVPLKSNPKAGYLLLVTARHIADPQWAGCPPLGGTIRAVFNKTGFDPKTNLTGTVEINLAPFWIYPQDQSVDIAVTVLNVPEFLSMNVENQPITISQLPTPAEVQQIGAGAQIASAGLLLGASGVKRNYPIFKFGYVSSKPDEKMSVACCVGCIATLQTEWLVAASLVAGNSGSPIFFVPVGFPGFGQGGQRPFLLGVQSTSFTGSDVAGMAPVGFLVDLIKTMNLPDADLGTLGLTLPPSQATPSSAYPNPVVAGSLPVPK